MAAGSAPTPPPEIVPDHAAASTSSLAAADAAALLEWLAGRGPLPTTEALRAAGLAPYAYAATSASDPQRAALRGDFLATIDQQLRTRTELAPLVAAWRRAGIDVLLYKGFALAEFVYPTAGCRPSSDVDVLVAPADTERAEAIARRLGWQSDRFLQEHLFTGSTRTPSYHAVSELTRPGGAARIDLHRAALHTRRFRHGDERHAPARITRALWEASEERAWGEPATTVRIPSAVDSALVGIVLQRCWGGDRWRLRPRDLVDLRVLAERAGVTRAAIEARARELGCSRTLAAFLDRCDRDGSGADPFEPPNGSLLRRLDRVARPERGLLGVPEMIGDGLRMAPGLLAATLAVLPDLRRVRRALDRHQDIHRLLRSLDHQAAPERHQSDTDTAELFRVYQGVVWAARLVPHRTTGRCLYVSLLLYTALRRRGYPATFVSGVRRTAAGITGHAWVELGDQLLDPVGDTDRAGYVVNLRHPATDAAPLAESVGARQTA